MSEGVSVVGVREQSTMVSNWDEYLCFSISENGKYRLDVRQYENLASIYDYYEEETDEYNFPDEIDGKSVLGQEDESIVGGDLVCWRDEAIEVADLNDFALRAWLKENDWPVRETINAVRALIA